MVEENSKTKMEYINELVEDGYMYNKENKKIYKVEKTFATEYSVHEQEERTEEGSKMVWVLKVDNVIRNTNEE